MTEVRRPIDVKELPESVTSEVVTGDTELNPFAAAEIKGGVRVGKNAGIRPLREIRKISGSSGDPGI